MLTIGISWAAEERSTGVSIIVPAIPNIRHMRQCSGVTSLFRIGVYIVSKY